MMHRPNPRSPVWEKWQRRTLRRRKARECAKRLVCWIAVIAEANFFVDAEFAEKLFNQAARIAEAAPK